MHHHACTLHPHAPPRIHPKPSCTTTHAGTRGSSSLGSGPGLSVSHQIHACTISQETWYWSRSVARSCRSLAEEASRLVGLMGLCSPQWLAILWVRRGRGARGRRRGRGFLHCQVRCRHFPSHQLLQLELQPVQCPSAHPLCCFVDANYVTPCVPLVQSSMQVGFSQPPKWNYDNAAMWCTPPWGMLAKRAPMRIIHNTKTASTMV